MSQPKAASIPPSTALTQRTSNQSVGSLGQENVAKKTQSLQTAAAMWEDLLNKQSEVETRDVAVQDREDICNQLYAELEQWQQALEHQHQQLEGRSKLLQTKKTQEITTNKAAKKHIDILKLKKREHTQREKELKEIEDKLTSREAAHKLAKSKLDKAKLAHRREVAAKEAQLSDKAAALLQREKRIAKHEGKIKQQKEEIGQLQQKSMQRMDEVLQQQEEWEEEFQHLQAAAAEKEAKQEKEIQEQQLALTQKDNDMSTKFLDLELDLTRREKQISEDIKILVDQKKILDAQFAYADLQPSHSILLQHQTQR